MFSLSPDTQLPLLLTAPLITSGADASRDILSAAEYRKFTELLSKLNFNPAALLTSDANNLPAEITSVVDAPRFARLLSRGLQLSQAVERWHSRAIWVVGKDDENYPKRFKDRLKDHSPPVIYGCGEVSILETGGLAVVGSRDVDPQLIEFTQNVGALTAQANKTLVSGGARGIDQAAMRGALAAGGKAVGVMADSLERAALNREHRDLLLDSKLVLISPYDPSAGFNVGHAMQRNKLIYALADAALVVNSDFEKGGTWAGAAEQLDKWHFVPIYVRSTGDLGRGLEALQRKGAIPWPNSSTAEEVEQLISQTDSVTQNAPGKQLSFLDS